MGRLKEQWNDLLPYEKIFYVIDSVLLCGGLVVACLDWAGYDVIGVVGWLCGLISACTAVALWRKNPFFAFGNIIFAFVFLVYAISGLVC